MFVVHFGHIFVALCRSRYRAAILEWLKRPTTNQSDYATKNKFKQNVHGVE